MKVAIYIFFSYHVPGSAKARIYAGKSTKRGFSKKGLTRIDFFFLFYVPMNLLKAWNANLGAGSFLPSKNLYRKCALLWYLLKPRPVY